MFSLKNKVAVVTGGGRGIGKGISLSLAEAGASLVLTGRKTEPLEVVAQQIRSAGGRALALPGDIAESGAGAAIADAAIAELGRLDIWVNNAGSASPKDVGKLLDIDEGQWDRVVDLNMKSWMGAVVASKHMQEDGGSIINISSRASFGPQLKNGPYGASKAAVNSLTQTLSVELAPKIRVNAVAPGPIPTENFNDSMGTDTEEKRQALLKQIGVPLQRFGREEDIAAAVTYMASPASSWVTGQCLIVTGGR